MDTNELVKDVKARFNINFQKQQLKEKYNARLIIADQGGLWKATPEIISFLSSISLDEIVILDSYDNPVKVNRQQLLKVVNDTYNSVMIEWHNEFKKLENNR